MSELMTIRRSTPADELVRSVPKPKKSVPKRSLPFWKAIGLEQKLPLVTAPKNVVVFSRGKIGDKLWKKSDSQDFVLYDPNCLDVSYKYEPLHDKHLKNYFANKGVVNMMKDLGLVTENGDAVCSLKEFNEYRRYLRRLHMDSVNKERMRREDLDKKRRDLETAKRYAVKDAEAAARAEARRIKMAGVMAKIRREEQMKKERILMRAKEHQMQMDRLDKTRKAENEKRKAQGRARDCRIREKIKTAERLARKRKVVTIRRWREGEEALRRRLKMKRRERQRKKRENERRRWNELIESQKSKMERINELLEDEAKEREFKINLRKMMLEKQWAQMEDLLQRVKEQRGRKLSFSHKRLKAHSLTRSLFDKWKAQVSSSEDVPDQKTLAVTMNNALLSVYSGMPNNDGIVEILEEAKIRLAEKVILPPDITGIVDEMLGTAIDAFLKKKVTLVVENIISRGIQTVMNSMAKKNSGICKLQSVTKIDDSINLTYKKRTSTRASTTLRVGYDRENRKSRLTVPEIFFSQRRRTTIIKQEVNIPEREHYVCFGKVSDIGVTTQEITVPELKSVKDRPPTPVPSLSDLAMAVFNSPISKIMEEDKLLTRSNSMMSMHWRDELIQQINSLEHDISRRVYGRLQKEMETGRERKYHTTATTQEDIINNMVKGIQKEGLDYSSNMDKLESTSNGIVTIILNTIWTNCYQVQSRKNSAISLKSRGSTIFKE